MSNMGTIFGIFVFRHDAFSLQMLLLYIFYCVLLVLIISRQLLGMMVDISLVTYPQMDQHAYIRRAATLVNFKLFLIICIIF